MGLKNKISKIHRLLYKMNLEVLRPLNRESIKFAEKYFNNREIIFCEIGVFKGAYSKEVLKRLNIEYICLIDPYLSYDAYRDTPDKDSHLILEKKAKKNLKKWEFKTYFLRENSDNAFPILLKQGILFDMIYIDGDHRYDYVKKDLENYWDLLNYGGIISGHDINTQGVSKAVLEFVHDKKLDLHIGERRDWWIVK